MKKYMKIIPLGGVGRIGYRNCTVYEDHNSIVVVDMGLAFPEGDTPGIDFTIVDTKYLEKNIKKVKAIIITHGHYDHIGGLVHMWKKVPVKLYTMPFALEVIKAQFAYKKAKLPDNYELMEFRKEYQISEGFSFEMVQTMHSIPQTGGVYFKINGKKIFHISDFRFDDTPVLPEATDYERLEQIGDAKLDMLLVDSTSVFSPDQLSETEVKNNTLALFQEAKEAIAICCFASNTSRVLMTLQLAEMTNRKVVVLGGSLQNMLEGAIKTDLIDKGLVERTVRRIEEVKNMSRNQLVYLGTGSQGEEMSAMSRLARDELRGVRLENGDTLIHSAMAIPGNEESVWNMFELMAGKGVYVKARHNGHKIHASGHASQSDLIRMFKLVRAKVVVPIHGTTQHMSEVEQVITDNSHSVPCTIAYREFIHIGEDNMLEVRDFKEDTLLHNTGEFAVDGSWLLPLDDYFIFRQRKFMHEEGAVFISMAINKAGMIVSPPAITSKGLGDEKKLQEVYTYAMTNIFRQMKANNMDKAIKDEEKAKEIIRVAGRKAFIQHRGKKPMTVVSFVTV
jgi:ribonuclease J